MRKVSSDSEAVFVRTVSRKLWCIRKLGGLCLGCGLDLEKQPWIAHFHHRIPEEKLIGVMAFIGSSMGMELVIKEIDKCDLLCANCHATKHFRVETYKKYIDVISEKSLSVPQKPRHIDFQMMQTLRERIKSGATLKQLSKEFGYAPITIRKSIGEEVPLGNGLKRKITDEQLLKEVEAGLSDRLIGLKYGMTYKTVWKRRQKLLHGRGELAI